MRPRLLRLCHRPGHRHDHRLHGGSFATSTTRIRTYTDPSVLVIDDVGITPFDRAQANALLFKVVGEAAGRVCHSCRDLPLAHAGFRRRRGQAGAKGVGSVVVGLKANPEWRRKFTGHSGFTRRSRSFRDRPRSPRCCRNFSRATRTPLATHGVDPYRGGRATTRSWRNGHEQPAQDDHEEGGGHRLRRRPVGRRHRCRHRPDRARRGAGGRRDPADRRGDPRRERRADRRHPRRTGWANRRWPEWSRRGCRGGRRHGRRGPGRARRHRGRSR